MIIYEKKHYVINADLNRKSHEQRQKPEAEAMWILEWRRDQVLQNSEHFHYGEEFSYAWYTHDIVLSSVNKITELTTIFHKILLESEQSHNHNVKQVQSKYCIPKWKL